MNVVYLLGECTSMWSLPSHHVFTARGIAVRINAAGYGALDSVYAVTGTRQR